MLRGANIALSSDLKVGQDITGLELVDNVLVVVHALSQKAADGEHC